MAEESCEVEREIMNQKIQKGTEERHSEQSINHLKNVHHAPSIKPMMWVDSS